MPLSDTTHTFSFHELNFRAWKRRRNETEWNRTRMCCWRTAMSACVSACAIYNSYGQIIHFSLHRTCLKCIWLAASTQNSFTPAIYYLMYRSLRWKYHIIRSKITFLSLWHVQSIMWAGVLLALSLSLPRLCRCANSILYCSTEATSCAFFLFPSCCGCWNPNSDRVKRYRFETTTFSTCFIFYFLLRYFVRPCLILF